MDRAKWRNTLTYWITRDLQIGVEYNPLAGDVGPLANWRILAETDARPALILGTSSDRIGTKTGRSVYLTASKSLERFTGLPVSPYLGISYGASDDRIRGIGGLSIRYNEAFSSMHMFDGVNLHHQVIWSLNEHHSISLLLVQVGEDHFAGISYAVRF